MASDSDATELETQSGYTACQMTIWRASWTETGGAAEGRFPLQLILGEGVGGHALEVDADDLDLMLKLLRRSGRTTFDCDRKVPAFANVDA